MSVFPLFGAVVGAAHVALDSLATLLTPVAGSLSTALAIVAFTLLVRLAISPLTYLQARGERRRRALAPRLSRLREEHRHDPVRLATETLALQRANGAGPFVSVLPGLAQAPFFMVMYRVAASPGAGAVFGVPLTAHLSAGLPVFAALLAAAAVLAWWSARRIRDLPEQVALMRYLPWLTVVMVGWLPLAGGLYLVTSSFWTALEQAFWRRRASQGQLQG